MIKDIYRISGRYKAAMEGAGAVVSFLERRLAEDSKILKTEREETIAKTREWLEKGPRHGDAILLQFAADRNDLYILNEKKS